MEGSKVFISSCSRREFARRRPSRTGGALRLQIMVMLIVLLAGFGAFVAGRGGL
jgi:hypothetical protein